MKALVLGSRGQLGRELMSAEWPSGVRVVGLGRAELDITDREALERSVAELAPAIVVNAAAYTAVDRAESEPEAAELANHHAPATLARACARQGAALIHVSTDYVFDGERPDAYREADAISPLGVYGRSKAAGEAAIRQRLEAHLIVRTSWVFGEHGSNFVKTILRLAAERDQLRVVADQRGRPTPAADLARALVALVDRCRGGDVPWGTYHFAGAGAATWHQVAELVVERQAPRTGRRPEVVPIATSDYPTPARRPKNSVLATEKLERTFGVQPEPWQQGARRVVDALLARPDPLG